MRLEDTLRLVVSPQKLLTPDSKYVFLLSHMRSRSSLLSHIVASSPEVDGAGELQICYNNVKKGLVKNNLSHSSQSRLVFDKILHNELTKNDDFFGCDFKFIIMLRPIEDTIQSLASMWKRDGYESSFNPEGINYLIKRLEFLKEKAQLMKGKFYYIDSDQLVSTPELVLYGLSNFLELSTLLSDRYEVTKDTGNKGYGDTSEFIQKGKIVETHFAKSAKDKVILNEKMAKSLTKAWIECEEKLKLYSFNKNDFT